ncbi:TPM domain-containing protein [Flavobacteriales bacterium]|jgi:uncharacterized membrane protein|nr:TPM domain-containing protein [Flavobacteriales bacterium]MDB9932157.1 TPM domain-containing protein [Flavobacteriales bacterium]MDC0015141.1 TPM domain-containing protein [Flavobacteriales bacterium]MDC1370750.1 TPM domain-containing protein [Flavobacteriales bacterium]|tara:strand:+ start:141 stop:578 length:438 start_codon:yes stop_codon:yes gene_type:complete
MNLEKFLNEKEEKSILEAIKIAETNTSGEIRVHLESECKGDVMERAQKVFTKLKMHKTELRNGVLFYVATESHHFAILGDNGIDEKVPASFWNETKELVISHLKNGERAAGLEAGILKAGEQLKTFFPYQSDDKNELSDEISTGI